MSDLADFFPFGSGPVTITDTLPGTATADQFIKVSSDGLSIIGDDGCCPEVPLGMTTSYPLEPLVLNTTSTQVQEVWFQGANGTVTLPSPAAFTKGGLVFWIKNVGSYAFSVRDNNNYFIARINPRQSAGFVVYAALANVFAWGVVGEWDKFGYFVPVLRSVGDIAGYSSCPLDSLTQILTYVEEDTTDNVYSVAVTRSAEQSNVTFGTPVLLEAVNVNRSTGTFPIQTATTYLDTNKAFAAWTDDTIPGSSVGRASVLTWASPVLSRSTPVSFDADDDVQGVVADKLTTDKVLMAYTQDEGLNTHVYVRTATATGTSLAFGTKLSIHSTSSTVSNIEIITLSSTSAVVFYRTASVLKAKYVTVSGTTCTSYAEFEYGTGSETCEGVSAVGLDASTFVVSTWYGSGGSDNQQLKSFACRISGTTIINEEPSAPFGPYYEPEVQDITQATVRMVPLVFSTPDLSTTQFAVFAPALNKHTHPLASIGEWDGVNFNWTEAQVVGRGEVLDPTDTWEKFHVGRFGDWNSVCIFYTVSDVDSRGLCAEVYL